MLKHKCTDCNTILEEEEKVCPKCLSTKDQEEVNVYTDTDMAKLCEIALIYGCFFERGIVKDFYDMNEAFEAFRQIYKEWISGIGEGIFETEEEEGYVTAYASRIIPVRFALEVSK